MSLSAKVKRWGIAVIPLGAVMLMGVLILPSEGNANPGTGGYSHHGGRGSDFVGHALHRLLRGQKDLNLSEEQTGKIRTIAMDYAKTRIRGKSDVKVAEIDVRSLMRDEKADLPAIETALKKSESARTALRLEGVKALRTAFAVLTPEQREKWRSRGMERHQNHNRAEGGQEQGHGDGPMAGPQDPTKREG